MRFWEDSGGLYKSGCFQFSQVAAENGKSANLSLAAFNRKGKLIAGILGEVGCWNGLEISVL